MAKTRLGYEDVIDVERGSILGPVAPIEGRMFLMTMIETGVGVVGAYESIGSTCSQRIGVVTGLARTVPAGVVVKVSGDDCMRT